MHTHQNKTKLKKKTKQQLQTFPRPESERILLHRCHRGLSWPFVMCHLPSCCFMCAFSLLMLGSFFLSLSLFTLPIRLFWLFFGDVFSSSGYINVCARPHMIFSCVFYYLPLGRSCSYSFEKLKFSIRMWLWREKD